MSIEQLREKLRATCIQREFFAFSGLPGEGLPRGAITELFGLPGGGKSEVALQALAENPSVRVAWVESELTAYPCAFPMRGVGLERVLFAETAGHALWAALQILRSQLFGIVVLTGTRVGSSERELRRLQLEAEKAQSALLLLEEQPSPASAWPISIQIQVERSAEDESPRLKILKHRGQTVWKRKTG